MEFFTIGSTLVSVISSEMFVGIRNSVLAVKF